MSSIATFESFPTCDVVVDDIGGINHAIKCVESHVIILSHEIDDYVI
jgi:hypothetical protein